MCNTMVLPILQKVFGLESVFRKKLKNIWKIDRNQLKWSNDVIRSLLWRQKISGGRGKSCSLSSTQEISSSEKKHSATNLLMKPVNTDVSKIDHFKISKTILEHLKAQNVSKQTRNGLQTLFQLSKQLKNKEKQLFRSKKHQFCSKMVDFWNVWSGF